MSKKILAFVLIFSFAVSIFSMTTEAAEKRIYAEDKKIWDYYGVLNFQHMKGTTGAFFRIDTKKMEKKGFPQDYYYPIYKYQLVKDKVKKIKTKVNVHSSAKLMKIMSDSGNLADGCLDWQGGKIFFHNGSGNKGIYWVSLTDYKYGKVHIANMNKTIKNYVNNSDWIKCYSLGKDKIAIRIPCDETKTTKTVNDDEPYYICILNTKTNRLVEQYKCGFRIEGMDKKYIYGIEEDSKGCLCIRERKKGGRTQKFDISNPFPDFELHPVNESGWRKQYERIVRKGNYLYYTTNEGVFKLHIKTGKIQCVVKKEESSALKDVTFVAGMILTKKNELYMMASSDWREGYRIVKIQV